MQVKKYVSAQTFLKSMQHFDFHLVFLDIYMQQTTGVEIAKTVRRKFPDCQIVFTTASSEHAVEAFRLRALDYLTKPYSYEMLEESLHRFDAVSDKFVRYIEVKEGRYLTRILLSDILYTDYSNHYIQIHTTNCVIRSYMSFGDFSPMLEPYPQFLWCYRNCMVNMDYIESLEERDFILKNKERIPISRARKKEITQAYANYLFDFVNGEVSL